MPEDRGRARGPGPRRRVRPPRRRRGEGQALPGVPGQADRPLPQGGRTHRATGCAPRFKAPAGAGLATSLSRLRAFALKLTPEKVRKLRRARAARRVLKADRVTDAALGTPVRAASVSTGSDSRSVDGPPGTKSTVKGTSTEWRGNESKIGREVKAVVDTKSTRLAGSDSQSHKLVEFKYLMDRCPDGGGLGRGTVSHLQSDRLTIDTADGGRAVTTTTSAASCR